MLRQFIDKHLSSNDNRSVEKRKWKWHYYRCIATTSRTRDSWSVYVRLRAFVYVCSREIRAETYSLRQSIAARAQSNLVRCDFPSVFLVHRVRNYPRETRRVDKHDRVANTITVSPNLPPQYWIATSCWPIIWATCYRVFREEWQHGEYFMTGG